MDEWKTLRSVFNAFLTSGMYLDGVNRFGIFKYPSLGPEIVKIGHLGPKIQFYSNCRGFTEKLKTGNHYAGDFNCP